jgi:branched-subunit amino acid transport protein
MTGIGHGYWSYAYLFAAGFCATQPWRYLGFILSRDIDEDAEILLWVRAVSTALVAGLVTRMVLLPAGALASVALEVRLAAYALGLLVYFVARRSLAAGVLSGAGSLMLAQFILVP